MKKVAKAMYGKSMMKKGGTKKMQGGGKVTNADIRGAKKEAKLKRIQSGSYSQKGLWDNIRANKGSGKTPTKSMLKQEKKIKASTKKKK
jgi:hypothetical protein